MKLFVKLMIAALFIALLLPFTILKNESGKTLMSFSDFSLPDFSVPDMPGFSDAKNLAPSVGNFDGQDIFYRWYDADGNVQFTSEPPAQGIEYTIKGYDPNANVIQAVKIPPKEVDSTETTPTKSKSDSEDIGNPYSEESIKKLFEDAENVEKLLNQRLKDQESAINQ
ncbi:MAG: DUF4124 domain-containing protein [Gammaproteobacteria bacterium]|nr:DUF4124 domain-containing protein [Gammaproteobacteria bacterium]